MDIYRGQIETIRKDQLTLLKIFRNELLRCPKGSIGTGKDHGKVRVYHSYKEDGKYRKRSIAYDPSFMQALARKEYLKKMISRLENNLKYLDRTLLHLQDLCPSEVIATLPKAYTNIERSSFLTKLADNYSDDHQTWVNKSHDLPTGAGKSDVPVTGDNKSHDLPTGAGKSDVPVTGAYNSDDLLTGVDISEEAVRERIARHRQWGSSPFRQSSYKPEGRNQPTTCGIMVRSKSEQAIVEKLHSYEIPFHYEEVIPIGEYEYSADFTFECKGNRLLYWEHAGMMDDPNYAEKHMKKLQMYHTVGIDLGHNLITTYEVGGKLDINMIDSVIRHQIITRL